VSCGNNVDRKPVYPVQGQVFVDGKSAVGAYVLFHPANDSDAQPMRPHGQVKPGGTFILSTYAANDGAPVGEYVVTLDWRKVVPGHGPKGPSLIAPEFSQPQESPLRATIRAESNSLAPFQAKARSRAAKGMKRR